MTRKISEVKILIIIHCYYYAWFFFAAKGNLSDLTVYVGYIADVNKTRISTDPTLWIKQALNIYGVLIGKHESDESLLITIC